MDLGEVLQPRCNKFVGKESPWIDGIATGIEEGCGQLDDFVSHICRESVGMIDSGSSGLSF